MDEATSLASQHFDVVVVGGGFAGTAAAINLARANRKVCLVDAGTPRNRNSEHMHGVIGLDAENPSALLTRGQAEFVSYGGLLIDGRVETLEHLDTGDWSVKLASGEASTASQVLVATGITDVLPEVPGLSEMWGTRVFHCPYCHGYEVNGTNLGVVGGKNPGFTTRIATLLTKWASSVTLYSNGMDLSPEQRERLEQRGVALVVDEVSRVSPATDDDHTVEKSKQQRVPMILIAKCGTMMEMDSAKPGNRGKRDSQMILLNFLQRVTYDDPMTPLDYDLFRKVHALIFTAVVSRHMFVWLTYSQTLTAVIAASAPAMLVPK